MCVSVLFFQGGALIGGECSGGFFALKNSRYRRGCPRVRGCLGRRTTVQRPCSVSFSRGFYLVEPALKLAYGL